MNRLLLCLPLSLLGLTLTAEEDWFYPFEDAEHGDFEFRFEEDADPEEVFTFTEDRGLLIKGKDKPAGYLQTLDDYEFYELQTDWRWVGSPGESGLLLNSTSVPYWGIWPESIEVQLEKKNSGDFWLLGSELKVLEKQLPEKAADRERRFKLTDAEATGRDEWNTLRILLTDETIEVYLNDELVNKGKEPSLNFGYITIQSQGSDIEFRDFRIRDLSDDEAEEIDERDEDKEWQ